jgi:AcrR family transcriptional regulator
MRTVDPERHAARRAQILDGAAIAFAQKGYDNTTVKDVYTAAGVGSGTLFHYFADKRAIFHAVLEADRDTLLSDLAGIDTTDAHAAVWAVIDRMTADLHDPTVGAMMLAILGQLTVDPRVAEILEEGDAGTRVLLADLIGRLQDAGHADPDWDPAHAAQWAQLMVDGLYLRCSDADFDADTEVSRLRIVLSRALVLRER